ncbi:unnamed protein product, partial [Anisakis simplex]|uniref:ShKT domain-containing protein n=1 Tax=Anisakis simplex TaxID=6269 RepID=A0A0M3KE29_ANISI
SSEDDDNPITVRFKCRRNGCCDQHEWCRFWASVGECITNKDWMEDNCQLACNTCKRPSVTKRTKLRNPSRRVRPPHRVPPKHRRPSASRRPPQMIRTRVRVTRPPAVTQQTQFFATQQTSFTRPQTVLTARLTPLQRCKQIQADPSIAAELLIRERLVFPTE